MAARTKTHRQELIVGLILLLAVSLIVFHRTQDSNETSTLPNEAPSLISSVYADIPETDIMRIGGIIEPYCGNPSEPYPLFSASQVVVIARIDSIDNGEIRSVSSEGGAEPSIYTHGKLTVLESFKGSVSPGTQLNYSRNGGIVPYNDWYNLLREKQKTSYKNDYDSQRYKYVELRYFDDIRIEAGKTYLVFTYMSSSESESVEDYMIWCWEYGLREIKNFNGKSTSDTLVLNNGTGQWEPLNEAIPLD